MPAAPARLLLLAAAVILTSADAAGAQLHPAVSLSAGGRLYDRPDATDIRAAFAVRGELPVGRIVLEVAGSSAEPPGRTHRATTRVLEAQVQLPIPIGPTLTPYFGVGGGVARTTTDGVEDDGTERVFSGAAGVKAALWEQLGVVADARVRGLGTDFEWRHFDVTVGLRYQFGRPDRPRFRGAPRRRGG